MRLPFPKLLLLALVATAPVARAIGFSAWIASYGLSGGNATVSADPDGDGVPNLLEYALDGYNPTITDSTPPTSFGFAKRTGNALGEWEWVSAGRRSTPPSDGISGVWHASMRWRPRPGVEGIRYVPQVSGSFFQQSFNPNALGTPETDGTLNRWYDGRGAFVNQMPLADGTIQSTCIQQGADFRRVFLRLMVQVAPGVADPFSDLALFGVVERALLVGTPYQAPRVVSSASYADAMVQDRNIRTYNVANTVPDIDWFWQPGTSNVGGTSATVTRSSSAPGVLSPDPASPYRWTYGAAGNATLTLSTSSASYSATVSVAPASGGTLTQFLSFTTGSLRRHVADAIDLQIAGKTPATAKPIFTTQDHAGGVYVRNAGCWAAPYVSALTALSPWNSTYADWAAGTLVSPRHVIFATHFRPAVGATMRFVAADNTVVTRTITAQASLPTSSGDITIGLLDSDVPGTISFARVLPDNYATKLPLLTENARAPVLSLDYEEKALVAELASITSAQVAMALPADATRRAFNEDIIWGDSGNPSGLLINGQFVILTVWTSGGGGSGTNLVPQKSALNALMTTLGGGYQLTDADLSGFPTF